MPMLTGTSSPRSTSVAGDNPGNSSGEAATFPKALDTTNKEESLCTLAVVGRQVGEGVPKE
jgi:hypothetical protein